MTISGVSPDPERPSIASDKETTRKGGPTTTVKKVTSAGTKWIEPPRKETAAKIQRWLDAYSKDGKIELLSMHLHELYERNNTYTKAAKKVDKVIEGIEGLRNKSEKLAVTKEISIYRDENGALKVDFRSKESIKKPDEAILKVTSPTPPSAIKQEVSHKISPLSIEGPSSFQKVKGGRAIELIKNYLPHIKKGSSYALGVTVTYLGILLAGSLALASTLGFAFLGATLGGALGHMLGAIAGILLGAALGFTIGSVLFRKILDYTEPLAKNLKGESTNLEDTFDERMSITLHARDNTD